MMGQQGLPLFAPVAHETVSPFFTEWTSREGGGAS